MVSANNPALLGTCNGKSVWYIPASSVWQSLPHPGCHREHKTAGMWGRRQSGIPFHSRRKKTTKQANRQKQSKSEREREKAIVLAKQLYKLGKDVESR